GLKYDPDDLEAMFGPERGAKLVKFAGRAADTVFDLIEKHRMDVPHVRNGWIQGAHSRTSLTETKRRAEQWARRGAPVEWLDKAETDRHLGSAQYLGGWIDRRGGAVQPLAYARALAKAAIGAGVALHGETEATRIAREGSRWVVSTRNGARASADRVAICTNAYAGELWPPLRQT